LQLGSPAASSINARCTHPGRPPNRTQQACGRFDCKLRPSLRLHTSYPGSRGLLCRSSLHLLGFSESDDRGWPSQAAGRTGQRPAASGQHGSAQAATRSAASSSVLSSQHASLLFVSILSQSKQLQIFFILSEFQFPSI